MTMCGNCIEGEVVIGEYRVSREMALDAGMPEMEGAFAGNEWDTCRCCGGDWQSCDSCALEEEFWTGIDALKGEGTDVGT